MKIRLIIIMILSTLLALEGTARTNLDRIVVISDTHLLSPELITAGNAIKSADAVELKMMAQSDDIMTALTDSIISIKPTLVLLTGDLTHNGERASHERMAQHLPRVPSALTVTRRYPPRRSPARSLHKSTATTATARAAVATLPR